MACITNIYSNRYEQQGAQSGQQYDSKWEVLKVVFLRDMQLMRDHGDVRHRIEQWTSIWCGQTAIQKRRNIVPENAKLLSALAFLTGTVAALACLAPLASFWAFCWRRGNWLLIGQWTVAIIPKLGGRALFGRAYQQAADDSCPFWHETSCRPRRWEDPIPCRRVQGLHNALWRAWDDSRLQSEFDQWICSRQVSTKKRTYTAALATHLSE